MPMKKKVSKARINSVTQARGNDGIGRKVRRKMIVVLVVRVASRLKIVMSVLVVKKELLYLLSVSSHRHLHLLSPDVFN